MIVFLTGFMGAGKTTAGKKLATAMGFGFTDLDAFIEEQEGISIEAYFETYGEAKFRQTEQAYLRQTANRQNMVVATGGGTPCFHDNMDWMNQHGVTVYLKMSPAALASRLKPGKDKRPLLASLNESELPGFIESRLTEREKYYSRAQVIFDGMSTRIDLLKESILAQQKR